MDKEALVKRQQELTDMFDQTEKERQTLMAKLKELETELMKLTGAYNEIVHQISLLPEEKK